MKNDDYKTQRDTLIRLFVEWWFHEPNTPRARHDSNSNYFNQAVVAVPELSEAVNKYIREHESGLTQRAADCCPRCGSNDWRDAIVPDTLEICNVFGKRR